MTQSDPSKVGQEPWRMIPKQLKLRNFLSYQEVVLTFDGLHVACVCGPNGAGKSSLLEAIAWCVWGQSRVSAEDDIVRQGAQEAQVSFCFVHGEQCYRIIRTRRRNQASALEFQILTELSQLTAADVAADIDSLPFKSLTQKGIRATQQYILQQIKIDYETFVNAAYLRQGRADEFMLKRPGERKQVLADLLKLSHYDSLAEQAKEKSRTYKAQVPGLEAAIARMDAQVATREAIQQDHQQLETEIKASKKLHRQQKKTLKALKNQQQQRLHWQQQLALAQQQHAHQQATLTASQLALTQNKQQFSAVKEILSQKEEIERCFQNFQNLQNEEEQLADRMQDYQQAQAQRLQIQQQLAEKQKDTQIQLAQLETQLEQVNKQKQAVLLTLAKKDKISENLQALRQAQKQLRQLDKIEAQSAPLRQRFGQIQGQIAQAHTRLATQIEVLDNQQAQMVSQQVQSPHLMEKAEEVSHRLAYLEKRREYQEAVRQKGIERRSFMAQLQANQRNYEIELAQLDQRLQALVDPDEAHCPLCEQAIVGGMWEALRDRTQEERNDVQNQIWAIREQLAVSEKEIQVLRQEYRVLEEELDKYAHVLEERGQLKAKLASADTLQARLQAMGAERSQLERCLQENDYAEELQKELKRIETQLAKMSYDDRDHALVRSQVERLRWSELKQSEIKQAERQLTEIQQQRPQLEASIQAIQTAIEQQQSCPEAQALKTVEQQLSELDYDLTQHNQLRAQLRAEQIWQGRYHALQQAKNQEDELTEKTAQLETICQQQSIDLETIERQMLALQQQLSAHPAVENEIAELETAIAKVLETRDRQLSQLGRLQQQLSQLTNIQSQVQEQQKDLSDIRHKYQVYRAVSEAFGRKGIQALMIENLLPQLEAMTNQILGRLSEHQLHVQFVTQRAGRKRKMLIDTLDILIADVRGTRPYETYSGGEAFRVNFAIRLAIARLLAMRSGTALQMLIVDEGFGTQDREGCDRLIAAIEAIAPDFACILTITHMPHFREAFQTRIDVFKDESGSHIAISG
ncbi:MAG: SMC family ATPase [Cyanobacteria bacterium J06634_6]